MKKSEKVWKNLENLDFEKKIWKIQNKSEKKSDFQKNFEKFRKKPEKMRFSEKIWKTQIIRKNLKKSEKIWEIQIFRKNWKIENFRFSGWKKYLNLNLN